MSDRKDNFNKVIMNNPQKRNIYFALVGVMVVAVGIGFWMVSKNQSSAKVGGGANLGAAPVVNSTPGSSTSPEYNKKLDAENKDKASEALKNNQGYVPTIVNNDSFSKDSPIDFLDKQKEAQRIAEEQARAKQEALDEERRRKEEADRLAALQKEQAVQQQQAAQQATATPIKEAEKKKYSMDDYVLIATATGIWSPKKTVSEFDYAREKPKDNQSSSQSATTNNQVSATTATTQSATQSATQAQAPYASAGTIFNAVLETAINSDEPSPVLAKIVSGDLKGARLIGSMTTSGEKVVVKFTTLSLPGKSTSTKLDSVAIDPQSSRTALASDVDRHYFLRYGVLLAASFLSGYSDAIARQNTTTTVSDSGNVVVAQGELSSKDINKQALGSVGKELANTTKTQIQDLKPTITVESGTAIGILLMSDLTIK